MFAKIQELANSKGTSISPLLQKRCFPAYSMVICCVTANHALLISTIHIIDAYSSTTKEMQVHQYIYIYIYTLNMAIVTF